MPFPKADVQIATGPPPAAALTNTGTKFLAGLALKGKTSGTLKTSDAITSLDQFKARHGDRQSFNGPDYDSVEGHFADGGTRLYFSRIAGPAAVRASAAVPTASSQFTATAKGPGAYANTYTVTVASGVVTVRDGATVLEVSPTLTTVADLQAWADNTSQEIDVTPLVATTTALSNSAAVTLAAGADDRTNITDTQRQTALDRFGKNLGPGQPSMPSRPSIEGYTMLATHARDNNRFAYGDAPDTPTAATVSAAGVAVRALGRELARHIQVLDPWLIAPGTTTGTTRTIPPSAVMSGLAARVDAGGNPNVAVAGPDSASRFATDVKYVRTPAEQDTLADAGVTQLINDNGVIYPNDDIVPVDLTTDSQWAGAAGNRLIMRIVQDALAIAKSHMFKSIAGQVDLVDFGSDLEAMLSRWLQAGALFTDDGTASGAYRVSVLDPVNTVTTLQQKKLNAALSLKVAPNSRFVTVTITNTPLTGTL